MFAPAAGTFRQDSRPAVWARVAGQERWTWIYLRQTLGGEFAQLKVIIPGSRDTCTVGDISPHPRLRPIKQIRRSRRRRIEQIIVLAERKRRHLVKERLLFRT